MVIFQIKKLHVGGIAVFPLIFIKEELSENRKKLLLNHERIHIRQQVELLVLPFYLFYIFNYLFNLIRYANHDKAYRNIIFEREAFANEGNMDYLRKRKIWSVFKTNARVQKK